MSEQLLDVLFRVEDTKEELVRKLRVLQDEVQRLARGGQISVVEGVIDMGQIPVSSGPPESIATRFLSITVDGQPYRLGVFSGA